MATHSSILAWRIPRTEVVVDTEGLEELGQDDAADRVDGIGTNTELALSDGINIGQAQVEY